MSNWLSEIKRKTNIKANQATFWVQKKSPELLIIGGIVTFGLALVSASAAILKVEEILDDHNERLRKVEDAREIAEEGDTDVEFNHRDYLQAKTVTYLKTGWEFGKLYASTVALTALSLTCFLTSRNILNKRYLGAVSAYNALSEVFKGYRKRVVDEYGESMDRHFRYGTECEKITVTEIDENGKKKKVSKDVETTDLSLVSPSETSRFFDSSNRNWDENPNYSMMFLRTQQAVLNDRLHSKGHVFLNEVYEALGFKATSEGAIVGWVDGLGDNCIDLGLYDPDKEICRKFVNGDADSILLEFNHDGIIWDKI